VRTDRREPLVVISREGRQPNATFLPFYAETVLQQSVLRLPMRDVQRAEITMNEQFTSTSGRVNSPNVQPSWAAVAGGAMVAAGSLMPFMISSTPGAHIIPGAKGASVIFGLVLAALGFALRVPPRPGRVVVSVITVGLCLLAGLEYGGLVMIGGNGIPVSDGWGDTVTVTLTPGVGFYVAVVGIITAGIAALWSLSHLPGRERYAPHGGPDDRVL
jgi:hypothetical protein